MRSVELDPGQGIAEGGESAARNRAAEPAPTPVEPGRERVSATVVVVFRVAA